MTRYLDPKVDLTFKKVFGEHKDLMMSFLNALLPLQPDREVVEIEYLSPELIPQNPTKKDSIVDVRCKDNIGRQFLVEMQMYWTDAFKQRALLNTCKAYSQPVERGMDYTELKPVYTLSIVNDIAFPELGDEFYHEYVPTNKNHADHTLDDFEMIFIELPKFKPSSVKDKKMMVLWLRFLTEINEQTRMIPEELSSDELLAKAIDILNESAYTDAELLAIDRYWDMVSRERTVINAAKAEGLMEGRAEGRAEERAKAYQEKLESARKLKQMGVAPEIISQAHDLSIQEIEAL